MTPLALIMLKIAATLGLTLVCMLIIKAILDHTKVKNFEWFAVAVDLLFYAFVGSLALSGIVRVWGW